MEKREVNIDKKKEQKPLKKRKRKPVGKKVIEQEKEKREYKNGEPVYHEESHFNQMYDYL